MKRIMRTRSGPAGWTDAAGPNQRVTRTRLWVALRVMPNDAAGIVCLAVRCDRSAPLIARAALDEIPGLDSVRDDARLVASELVTNAVLHSKCAPDDLIEVRAQRGEGHLLISVHDPGDPDQTLQPKLKTDRAPGGLGLRIVHQIARRWGAECPDGHLVWAELAM